jgi:hypothetical protein
MPFVIEKTKEPLYKEGLYEGKIEGKIESAILMIKEFGINPKDIAKKFNLPLEVLLKKLKKEN